MRQLVRLDQDVADARVRHSRASVDRLPGHAYLGHALLAREREHGAERCSGDSLRASAASSVRRRAAQQDEVGFLARGQVADPVAEPSACAPARGGQPEQVRRPEPHAVGGEQLDLVGHQPLLEHAEAGARADVGAEREAHAGVEVAAHREDAAAEERVARRAVRDARARRGQAGQLAVGHVDVVGEHGAGPDEPVALVGLQVVAGPGEPVRHGLDLVGALVDVGGDERAVQLRGERTARPQHLLRAGEREARRDGVAQPAAAVPALSQLAGRRRRRRPASVRSSGSRSRSDTTRPLAIRRPLRSASAKKQLLGRREVGPEHERRGGAVGRQRPHEVARQRARVVGVGEPRLLGQRASRSQSSSSSPIVPTIAELRPVHVGVDQAGEQRGRRGRRRSWRPDTRAPPGGRRRSRESPLRERDARRRRSTRARPRRGPNGSRGVCITRARTIVTATLTSPRGRSTSASTVRGSNARRRSISARGSRSTISVARCSSRTKRSRTAWSRNSSDAGVVALHVEQRAGLRVQAELRPGVDLEQLLERAQPAGQRDEARRTGPPSAPCARASTPPRAGRRGRCARSPCRRAPAASRRSPRRPRPARCRRARPSARPARRRRPRRCPPPPAARASSRGRLGVGRARARARSAEDTDSPHRLSVDCPSRHEAVARIRGSRSAASRASRRRGWRSRRARPRSAWCRRCRAGPGVISDERAAEIAAAVPPGVDAFLLTSLAVGRGDRRAEPRGQGTRAAARGRAAAWAHARAAPRAARGQARAGRARDRAGVGGRGGRARAARSTRSCSTRATRRSRSRSWAAPAAAHDWEISRRIREAIDVPLYLAGGLRPENAARGDRDGRAVRARRVLGAAPRAGLRPRPGQARALHGGDARLGARFQNSTGRLSSPRSPGVVIHLTGPASSKSGMLGSSVSRTTRSCSRASGAPRQKWIPSPNPR